jgi:tripartite-type tricarboxylate transporter receptor subunit TctC
MQTTPQRRTLLALCLATATLIGAHPVQAQDAFPSRPITIIVPFAPGGGNDTVSRLIAEPLSAELKQPVIAVNKLGAGGAIGTAQVAKGTPDGYTIVMVEQNFRFAAPLADRFYVVEHGQIVEHFDAVELQSKQAVLTELLGV